MGFPVPATAADDQMADASVKRHRIDCRSGATDSNLHLRLPNGRPCVTCSGWMHGSRALRRVWVWLHEGNQSATGYQGRERIGVCQEACAGTSILLRWQWLFHDV